MPFKRWTVSEMRREEAQRLSEEGELHPFLTLLLTARGVHTVEEAAAFLLPGEVGDDPFGFADMDVAAHRVQLAIDRGESVAVYGDYDVDGITSTVLLYSYLREKNAQVRYYIPKREGEGYGLHREALETLASAGVKLVVTVDNGVTASAEVDYARELGMEVVVTDHHLPKEDLPQAVGVVDPHRADCGSECKDYAGVGVAFKLVCALEGNVEAVLESYADLVALGTLADVMPLTGENRVLVREGLRQMRDNPRMGLQALRRAAGVEERTVNASNVLFALVPRLNAAGRMGEPELAAELLLCEDDLQAQALAERLDGMNKERQTVEAQVFAQVCERLETQPELARERVLVVDGQDFHPGVMGIVAARVMEHTGKPCILLSRTAEEPGTPAVMKGSGRSMPGFSLYDAIAACGELLLHYGGHELAAGVGLPEANVEDFRARINEYAAAHCPRMPAIELKLDCKIRPAQMDLEKLQLIEALEPFGSGNPQPVFGLYDMRLESLTPMGMGKHLRLTLSRDGTQVSVMRFKQTQEEFPYTPGEVLHLAVTLEKNVYKGMVSVSAVARDIRPADTPQEDILAGMQVTEGVLRRDSGAASAEDIPAREDMAALYRLLRSKKEWALPVEQLVHIVGVGRMRFARLRLGLEVLREAGLITLRDTGGFLRIQAPPTAEKVDLEATDTMRFLRGIEAEG